MAASPRTFTRAFNAFRWVGPVRSPRGLDRKTRFTLSFHFIGLERAWRGWDDLCGCLAADARIPWPAGGSNQALGHASPHGGSRGLTLRPGRRRPAHAALQRTTPQRGGVIPNRSVPVGDTTALGGTLRSVSTSPFLAVALDAARGAGRLLREEIGGTRRIQHKGSVIDLVTDDGPPPPSRASWSYLAERFPDHGMLAEESGGATGGRPIPLGDRPPRRHHQLRPPRAALLRSRSRSSARERSSGCGLRPEPRRVLRWPSVAAGPHERRADPCLRRGRPRQALLSTGFPYDIRTTEVTNLPEYAELSMRAQAVRRLGSAVLDLCWVACGRLEGFWEFSLNAWDMAAGGLIVGEAGGRVTNVHGGPWRLGKDPASSRRTAGCTTPSWRGSATPGQRDDDPNPEGRDRERAGSCLASVPRRSSSQEPSRRSRAGQPRSRLFAGVHDAPASPRA